VGSELKKQMKVQAFYWMMNKTTHVTEFLSEDDYNGVSSLICGGASQPVLYLAGFVTVRAMFGF
jgi:Xaa-Pro aminopeptidase